MWQATFALPAGSIEYKAALDDSWAENYGLGAVRDGPNIPLAVGAAGPVKFFYDHATHWVTDNQNSVIATAPGSFQSELGCAADWDPGCLRSWLQDPDGDGIGRFSTSALPPGTYEFKVAIDESWDENYGAGGVPNGDNIALTVENAGDVVTLSYNQLTHIVEVSVVPAAPVDDAALVRDPVRHPFVDEILYFTLPDRFNDGDPANNCGDYEGECVAGDVEANVLRHGYLPSDKGYYHGGDIEGLRRKLPYLQALGITSRTQEIVRRWLPAGTRLRILDVGGGTGVHASWLAEDGHRVHVLDPVPSHVERVRSLPGNVTAELGDARRLRADDASYDAVLLLRPLYHLTDREDRLLALREAGRVVAPDGPVFAKRPDR